MIPIKTKQFDLQIFVSIFNSTLLKVTNDCNFSKNFTTNNNNNNNVLKKNNLPGSYCRNTSGKGYLDCLANRHGTNSLD